MKKHEKETKQMKEWILRFGSETPDNKRLARAVKIDKLGRVCVFGEEVASVIHQLEESFDWKRDKEISAALRLMVLHTVAADEIRYKQMSGSSV